MIPWETCARASAPDGGELTLHRRGRDYVIRVDGRELMSNRSDSEEAMARIALDRLGARVAPRILVGGLGMGFTARAALDALPADAELVIAELVPALVAWNRGVLAELAGRPLEDPRVRLEIADVARVIDRAPARFDAILLDVDNGPQALTRPANRALYSDAGLARARRALRPGGLLVVWSAARDPGFERRLRRGGEEVEIVAVATRAGPTHSLAITRVRGPGGGRG